ncbi:MAG TPA: lytic transglycosylase domain-containing protein [Aliidongia sp.]|nr:lytic transglycosylase domain-containing protein [Aliidongia sp.]
MLPEAAAACIYFAAQSAALPPPILMTVLTVEAGHEGTHSPNPNGSEDYGPGQINTVWVGEIARTIHQSPEVTRALLQYDGCFNIRVTASLLRRQINAAGEFWTGVGWYHSRSKPESLKYIRKVIQTAKRLFGPQIIATTPVAGAATPPPGS